MSRRALRYLLYAVIALIAFGAGLMMRDRSQPAPAAKTASAADAVMAIRLPDLQDKAQSLEQWRGKVLVVNLWATWCAPCREEIPVFVRLQDKYRDKGLQFVGISIDQVDKTREFAATFKMNYPSLIGSFDTVDLTQRAGNTRRALPFTLVLDRKGQIAATELGGVTQEKLEALLGPML